MYHIRSVFHSHKNAAKLAGNSAAILWDYFQGGCMLTEIMKTSKIERLRVFWILCLDENLDKGNPLVYVDFYFVVLILV